MKRVPTVCSRDCYDTCFLIAEIDEDQQINRIMADPSNPVTQNYTCPRGKKDHERLYKNRILFPHIRIANKAKRDFKRTSWDEALRIIIKRITDIIDNDGAEKILFLDYAGNTGLATQFLPCRLWNALGATQTDHTICGKSGHDALELHYGLSYGIQPEEIVNMKAIFFWGFNAICSSPHLWRLAMNARNEKYTHIIVIDPRRTESAKKADIWIRPKPGSDIGLAYGIMNYLISHSYHNRDFIEKWTTGYELLEEQILKWTPKKIEALTGIEWTQVKVLGEKYGTLSPSTTMIGIGIQKNHAGAEMVRAISLIPTLLGYHRGFYYSNGMVNFIDFEYLTGAKLTSKKGKIVNQVNIGELVGQGEFKFIFINCMNPALTLPNQNAFRSGLIREDTFVVVHETHWTRTTDYSDIVLPAPTHFEKDDLVIPWSHNYIRKSLKVIDPLEESRDEFWLMQQLSRLLKIKDQWLYEDKWVAIEKSMEYAVANGSLAELHEGEILQLLVRPRDEYQTESNKIEFFSRKAEKQGLNPLPLHLPIDLKQDEFILLNSSVPKYTHTQFQEIYGNIPAFVEINPEDAHRLKIKDDLPVFIYNIFGEVKVQAKISDHVPIGVLWSPRQFEAEDSRPMNILTTGNPQRLGKGPKFNSTIVKIRISNKT